MYYLWQLTAEDHFSEVMLVDPTSSVLQVLNLTPGTYTFTLTVTDSSFQTSSDTVLVRILPGQCHIRIYLA